MSADDIGDNYVKYIGAGAVAAGGIISLFRAMPLIVGSLAAALGDLRPARQCQTRRRRRRTDRDIPLPLVALGALVADRRHLGRPPLGLALEPRQLARRDPCRPLRLSFRHGLLPPDRRDRIVVESDLRHDGGHAAVDVPYFPRSGLDRPRHTG